MPTFLGLASMLSGEIAAPKFGLAHFEFETRQGYRGFLDSKIPVAVGIPLASLLLPKLNLFFQLAGGICPGSADPGALFLAALLLPRRDWIVLHECRSSPQQLT